MTIHWEGTKTLESKEFKCGHCGKSMVSNTGYIGYKQRDHHLVYICIYCHRPLYLDVHRRKTVPGALPGKSFQHLPTKEVEELYTEARRCFTVGAHTAVVMCCRKILMNVAVDQGANPGEDFKTYVAYINSNNLISAKCKFMIAEIRDKGGEANHEIHSQTLEDADKILYFVEMLLENCYEVEGKFRPREQVEDVNQVVDVNSVRANALSTHLPR